MISQSFVSTSHQTNNATIGKSIFLQTMLHNVEGAVDSVNFFISHHYWTGYNFQATDSLHVETAPPLKGLPDYGALLNDTVRIDNGDNLVVAKVMYVPNDTTDSVWVKVARDQLTQGWVRESTLLERVVPDDPISKFISYFSDSRFIYAL